MENHSNRRVWDIDWRAKIAQRLGAVGSVSVTDLLSKHPGKPYIHVAAELGEDVAAFQLEYAQFEEGLSQNNIRFVAMDSLARDLRSTLSTGWKHKVQGDFDTSRAFGIWSTRLIRAHSEFEPKVAAVWAVLKELPPAGWVPSGPDDPIIVAAFDKGWPPS